MRRLPREPDGLAATRRSPDSISSQSLDPGELFQDALHLAEQLPALVQETPLLRLEPADGPEPDPETLGLAREVRNPGLEAATLCRELGVLRAEGPDQVDCPLNMLLEQRHVRLDVVVTHRVLLAQSRSPFDGPRPGRAHRAGPDGHALPAHAWRPP